MKANSREGPTGHHRRGKTKWELIIKGELGEEREKPGDSLINENAAAAAAKNMT